MPGTPAPQGSKTAITRNGRTVLIEASKGFKPWRDAVVSAAKQHAGKDFEMLDEPVSVSMTFLFRKPPTTKFEHYPAGKPDADKCARLVNDALTISGLIRDDSRIVFLAVEKRWATNNEETGVWVSVSNVTV